MPTVYLFYPETAGRSLEDLDRLFRENQDIFVFKHSDAISYKRPAALEEHYEREYRHNSSAVGISEGAARQRLKSVPRANEEIGYSYKEKVQGVEA